MTREEQIQEILDAIEKKEYKISYDEPGSVSFCEFKNGSKFFYVSGDDCKYGMDCGSCTIEVAGHEYTCNLGNGDWDGSDDLIEEYEVEDAISDIPEMWTSAFDDDESIVSFYCFCNGIKESYPIMERYVEEVEFDDFEQRVFNGISYAIIDELESLDEDDLDDDGHYQVLAMEVGCDFDDDGYFPCVLLTLNKDYDIVEVEEAEERYDSFSGEIID